MLRSKQLAGQQSACVLLTQSFSKVQCDVTEAHLKDEGAQEKVEIVLIRRECR